MANRFQKGPRLGDCFMQHRRTKTTFLDQIDELRGTPPLRCPSPRASCLSPV